MSIVINAVSSGLQRSYNLSSAHDSIRRNLRRYKNFPKKSCDEQIAVADTHLSSSMDSSGNDKSPITLSSLDACDQLLDKISTTVDIMLKAVDPYPDHGLGLPGDYEEKSFDNIRLQQERTACMLDELISKANLDISFDSSPGIDQSHPFESIKDKLSDGLPHTFQGFLPDKFKKRLSAITEISPSALTPDFVMDTQEIIADTRKRIAYAKCQVLAKSHKVFLQHRKYPVSVLYKHSTLPTDERSTSQEASSAKQGHIPSSLTMYGQVMGHLSRAVGG